MYSGKSASSCNIRLANLTRSYICSKNVNSYEHFGDISKGRCALHDNVEDVHEQAVKKAADEAMAKVKAENPNLADADLMIQVSDRVKKVELERRVQAIDRMNAFPYHMVGEQLVYRPGGLGGAPQPPRAIVRPPPQYVFHIPNVEEHRRPFPARNEGRAVEEEMQAIHDEPDFEGLLPHLHYPPHYPICFPPPPGLAWGFRSQGFFNPVSQQFLGPHASFPFNFYDAVGYGAHLRQFFPFRPPGCNQNHHYQHPNIYF